MKFWWVLLLPCAAAAVEIMPPTGEPAPLVEIGVFGGFGRLPDYPGSDQEHTRWLAFPFAVYRGKVLRSDDQSGVKARLLRNRRMDLDIGMAGSFPVNSSENDARRGMPDLDWIGEIGPRLSIQLFGRPEVGSGRLLLPVRAVLATDFRHLRDRGYTFSPTLALERRGLFGAWIGIAQLSSNFGTHRLAAYFYEVEARYATPERPAYTARAGYLGSELFVGIGSPKRYRFRIFSGVNLAYYGAAANLASPLFRARSGVTTVVGISWVFYKSLRPGYQ